MLPSGLDTGLPAQHDAQSIWAASPLAFVVIDGSSVVRSLNPAGERLFARASADARGRLFLEFVEPMDRGATEDMLRRARNGETPARQEARFVRPDASKVVGGLSIARMHGNDDDHTIAVIRDLSHEQTLRPNLLQTEKLATMGAVAATVAHEVNNPLMGASGALQTLRMLLTSTEKRELVDTALAEINRAARIVQDLRQFAHRGDDEKQRISLVDLLQSTAKLHFATHGHDVPVQVECAPDTPAIEGVRNQLVQALRNLMRNAHQAMQPTAAASRVITLRARKRGADAVMIEVADRGPGVPMDLRNRIWEAFFSTKNATEGTGLGLTVVQAVAASHGGRVRWSRTTCRACRTACGCCSSTTSRPSGSPSRDSSGASIRRSTSSRPPTQTPRSRPCAPARSTSRCSTGTSRAAATQRYSTPWRRSNRGWSPARS